MAEAVVADALLLLLPRDAALARVGSALSLLEAAGMLPVGLPVGRGAAGDDAAGAGCVGQPKKMSSSSCWHAGWRQLECRTASLTLALMLHAVALAQHRPWLIDPRSLLARVATALSSSADRPGSALLAAGALLVVLPVVNSIGAASAGAAGPAGSLPAGAAPAAGAAAGAGGTSGCRTTGTGLWGALGSCLRQGWRPALASQVGLLAFLLPHQDLSFLWKLARLLLLLLLDRQVVRLLLLRRGSLLLLLRRPQNWIVLLTAEIFGVVILCPDKLDASCS